MFVFCREKVYFKWDGFRIQEGKNHFLKQGRKKNQMILNCNCGSHWHYWPTSSTHSRRCGRITFLHLLELSCGSTNGFNQWGTTGIDWSHQSVNFKHSWLNTVSLFPAAKIVEAHIKMEPLTDQVYKWQCTEAHCTQVMDCRSAMDWMFVLSPKFICWNPNAQCDTTGRWGLHGVNRWSLLPPREWSPYEWGLVPL